MVENYIVYRVRIYRYMYSVEQKLMYLRVKIVYEEAIASRRFSINIDTRIRRDRNIASSRLVFI